MKITDNRTENEVNVGDLVITAASRHVGIGIVGYDSESDYPYFIMCLDDMEIVDGYEELQDILEDNYEIYAKRGQLELVIQ